MYYSALQLGPVDIILLLDCIIVVGAFDSHNGQCFVFFILMNLNVLIENFNKIQLNSDFPEPLSV